MIKVLIGESQYLIKMISHNLWITRKVNEHALTAKILISYNLWITRKVNEHALTAKKLF